MRLCRGRSTGAAFWSPVMPSRVRSCTAMARNDDCTLQFEIPALSGSIDDFDWRMVIMHQVRLNRWRQVASGRFGVTPTFLVNAEQLKIIIASSGCYTRRGWTASCLVLKKDLLLCRNELLPPRPTLLGHKKAQRKVVTFLLLGRDPATCTLYPEQPELYEAMKVYFKIDEENVDEVREFENAYRAGGEMMVKVSEYVRIRRSRILQDAKKEMWRLLGCPQVPPNASAEEVAARKEKLESARRGERWRVAFDADGHADPFRSDAVHGALAKTFYGSTYSRDAQVSITLEQAGFFLYGLGLAMKNETMDPHDTTKNRAEVRKCMGIVLGFFDDMQRIELVEQENLEEKVERREISIHASNAHL